MQPWYAIVVFYFKYLGLNTLHDEIFFGCNDMLGI